MTHQAINVNDVIDHAKFKPFHFNVVAWCLLIILFDGYDLAINGVVLPLLMDEWGLSAVQAKRGFTEGFDQQFGGVEVAGVLHGFSFEDGLYEFV